MFFFIGVRSSPVDPGIDVFESVLHVSNEIKILFLAVKYVGSVDDFVHVLFYRERECFDYLLVPKLDNLQ